MDQVDQVDQSVKVTPGRRQRKAQATRSRMLAAAEVLFVRDGYAATTIATIAEEADVAAQTVYAVFGNKRTILTELVATRVVGDDNPAPLRERPEWQSLETENDPRRQLALLATTAARIGSRIAGLYMVMAAVAASDAEIASIYQRQQDARYADQRRMAQSLADKDALRHGLTDVHAADIIWTLANPHTYRTLVIERGWSPGDYEDWLAGVLACSLLELCSPRSPPGALGRRLPSRTPRSSVQAAPRPSARGA